MGLVESRMTGTVGANCSSKPEPYCRAAYLASQLANTSGYDDAALANVDTSALQRVVDTHGEYEWSAPVIDQSAESCQKAPFEKDQCHHPESGQKRIHVGCFDNSTRIFDKRTQQVRNAEDCMKLALEQGEGHPYFAVGMSEQIEDNYQCFYGAYPMSEGDIDQNFSFSHNGLSSSCRNGTGAVKKADIYMMGDSKTGNSYARVYQGTEEERLRGKNVVLGSGIYSWKEIQENSPDRTTGSIALGPQTKMTIWELKTREIENPCNCSEMILPENTIDRGTVVGVSFE